VHGEEGEVSTVRYEAVNAMLLNEFFNAHRNFRAANNNRATAEADRSSHRWLAEGDCSS